MFAQVTLIPSESKKLIAKAVVKTKIVKDTNQDKTDLELAISIAESLDPTQIIIFGAIGNRIDHTLANILCLVKIKENIISKIIDDRNIIELINENTDIIGEKKDIVSIIPITDTSNLKYSGLRRLHVADDGSTPSPCQR